MTPAFTPSSRLKKAGKLSSGPESRAWQTLKKTSHHLTSTFKLVLNASCDVLSSARESVMGKCCLPHCVWTSQTRTGGDRSNHAPMCELGRRRQNALREAIARWTRSFGNAAHIEQEVPRWNITKTEPTLIGCGRKRPQTRGVFG